MRQFVQKEQEKFQKDPGKYVAASEGDSAKVIPAAHHKSSPIDETILYTCPMHPQVVQDHPGNCPICGMALEPAASTGEEGPNPELVDMARRFWASLVLTIPLLVVDKTGTLTEGKPKLVSVVAAPGQNENELLRLAASLERGSEHPLAAAIAGGVAERSIDLAAAEDFTSLTGRGITGKIAGRQVAVGNMSEEEVEVVMLTGDSRTTAEAVASKLGIGRVEAEVLPQEKNRVVRQLQEQGRFVAMAGDGVNDAPALAQAQVGIAMGTGTDVAMQSAAITLVKGDLRGAARARRLSHGTMRNIRQNLFFAFIYNALGVPIAAGALYPIFGILLSPIIAAAAMSLSSVSVIGRDSGRSSRTSGAERPY